MLTFVTTGDGSKTLFNSEVGENYHSKHGALQESRHVFLKSGLIYFLETNQVNHAKIVEVGFGTGLNFLLSADYCNSIGCSLQYTGIEAYPLPNEIISSTGYDSYVSVPTWFEFKEKYYQSLTKTVAVGKNVELAIAKTELMQFNTSEKFDVIYFDAFAAVHQPELWTHDAIAHITSFLEPGGVFVTYAITGNLKRSMKALGFKVEKAPGAPGKREMLRAIKL